MPDAPRRFQAPKGTRDMLPADLAVHRHVEAACRAASIAAGFEEIQGPMFEFLDLYVAKSGEGIVGELFSFRRAGGDDDYALRPELTPTVARMVAALGRAAPHPIKWFSFGSMFRAERPQRGRLREHVQWNVDLFGEADVRAETELLGTATDALARLGVDPSVLAFRTSHRDLVADLLRRDLGVADARLPEALALLDRRLKLPPEVFAEQARGLGMDEDALARLAAIAEAKVAMADVAAKGPAALPPAARDAAPIAEREGWSTLAELAERLAAAGLAEWCTLDLSIVRGLAYYTGTVFELHETSGRERAVAGGGRYDDLVERLGGPPTPAIGFAMGDVVIRLVLEDRGLLEPGERYLPRPDVFVVAAEGTDPAFRDALLLQLRRRDLHARTSYRTTTKVRKLLEEADRTGAAHALVLGDGAPALKDLANGEQVELAPVDATPAALAAAVAGRLPDRSGVGANPR